MQEEIKQHIQDDDIEGVEAILQDFGWRWFWFGFGLATVITLIITRIAL